MTALDIHRQLFAPALLPTKRGTWPGPPAVSGTSSDQTRHLARPTATPGTSSDQTRHLARPTATPGTSSGQTRHLARASALAASSQITRERET
jgi:hypothetical protein